MPNVTVTRILATIVAASLLTTAAYAVAAAGGPAGGPLLFVDADDAACTDAPAEGAGESGTPFCSIQAAIDFLEAGSPTGGELRLRAAEYDEGTITIDHGDLTIRGDPGVLRSAIIVHPQGSGDTGFHITDPLEACDGITIDHLTISGFSAQTTGHGILVDDVCDGHTFTDLDVRDWGEGGILFLDSSGDEGGNASDGVTIADSTISDNGGSGVELQDGTGNAITATDMTGNGGDGVTALRQTGLDIAGAELSGNDGFGLRDSAGSGTSVTGSTLGGNGQAGIGAVGPHQGLRVTGSTVSGNGGAGIDFRVGVLSGIGGADTTIAGSEIAENDGPGITSDRHDGLRIEDSSLTANGTGLVLAGDTDVTVDSNVISANLDAGIAAENGATLDITNNEIDGNGSHGLELNLGEANVTGNSLDGNGASGISARNLFGPVFANNGVFGSGGSGMDLRNNDGAEVRGNEVAAGAAEGIAVRNEQGLLLAGNDVHDNAETGIELTGGQGAVLSGNTVADNGAGGAPADYGINVFEESDLVIEKNTMSRNLDGEIVVDASDHVTMRKNDLLSTTDGVILRAGSSHAFGIVIGGNPGDGNRFRGLTPATNICESSTDACYVKVLHTILPGATFNTQRNDWGTTNLEEIENLICHDGEAAGGNTCGQNVLDVSNPAQPSDDSPVDKPPTPLPTPPGVLGDVNCDGTVTSIDALLVLQRVADLADPSCIALGDVDLDGDIDAIDAILILQFVAGIIDDLPP